VTTADPATALLLADHVRTHPHRTDRIDTTGAKERE